MSDPNKQRGRAGQLLRVEEILPRVKRLIDSPAASVDPLAWYVEAMHVGDVKTIAMTAIRSGEKFSP